MKPKTSNVAKLQSLKLGVSSFVPSLNASISTGSSARCGYRNRRNSFVVKAEAEAEAEAESEPETSNVVAEEEDIVEQEAEEVKPPRKPIVKLGDIMGVICFNLHSLLYYGFFDNRPKMYCT